LPCVRITPRGFHQCPNSAILERSGEGEGGSPGVFYYWKGERPRHPNAPQLEGAGEIQVEAADRAAGHFTPRSDTHPSVKVRTSGLYVRADPEDISILDGRDDRKRAELITERLRHGQSM
jgi:hypothetical protein